MLTKDLIGHIIGTQGIAVAKQYAPPTHNDLDRVLQQRRPCGLGKALRHQKISVAVHDEHRRPAVCQCLEGTSNGLRMRIPRQHIIARPILEQITQHVQRTGCVRCSPEKIQ